MKYTTLIIVLLLQFGIVEKSKACSPGLVPFKKLLDNFNKTSYIIVEGYFKPSEGNYFASKFEVTNSSDSEIILGNEYEVYEYGPFGDLCEMYEMKATIDPTLVGKNNLRLLIIYKERSSEGKLVTPIFWEAGADASNNKLVTTEFNNRTNQYISYECTIELDDIWKEIFTENKLALDWNELSN